MIEQLPAEDQENLIEIVQRRLIEQRRAIHQIVVAKGYLSAEKADRLLDAAKMTEGGIQVVG
jgi:aspartate ammonia-lyase